MCGRYVSVKRRAELLEQWDAVADGPELRESFNVAPSNRVYALVEHLDEGSGGRLERQVRNLRWGLVPSWAKDPKIGNRLVNARVETLADKPSWRAAFRKRRAVIPARGYYEWAPRAAGSKAPKQPFYLHPGGGRTLAFAGLYELWRDPGKADDDPDRWLASTVIITTQASGPGGEVHDRTPLILPADRVGAWLDPRRTDPTQVREVLEGIVLPPLAVRPVSTLVNKVGNDGPHLLDPIDLEQPDEPLQLTLTGRAA